MKKHNVKATVNVVFFDNLFLNIIINQLNKKLKINLAINWSDKNFFYVFGLFNSSLLFF